MTTTTNLSSHRPRVSIADGIALTRTKSGKLVLGTPDSPQAFGEFDDVRDAWKAIDAIDLAELETSDAVLAAVA